MSVVTGFKLRIAVFVFGTSIVIDVSRHSYWQCLLAAARVAASSCGGIRAGGIVDARRHWVGLCGADGSGDLNVTLGHVPPVVYYRVAVLFNKWCVSD